MPCLLAATTIRSSNAGSLEPEADYELRPAGGGGCEDPRITFGVDLKGYVMTYTALSPEGPRIALAISEDLFHWQRLGLVTFRPHDGIEFDGVDNKDASVFPVAIPDPDGQPAVAILTQVSFLPKMGRDVANSPRLSWDPGGGCRFGRGPGVTRRPSPPT
jgi:hypothetical protein